MFCCTLLYVNSSIAIILMGKRELIALLNLSSWCLVMVERLFLAVPRSCLQFVIVVFPDHTHLLFLKVLLHCHHYLCLQIQHIKYFVYILLSYNLDLIETLSTICRPCLFLFKPGLSPPVKYIYSPFQNGASFVDHLFYLCLVFVML